MPRDDKDETNPDTEFNSANQKEAAEQAHDHLCTAFSELTKARDTMAGGDEGVELTREIYPDVHEAIARTQDELKDALSKLRRFGDFYNRDDHPPADHRPPKENHMLESDEDESTSDQ